MSGAGWLDPDEQATWRALVQAMQALDAGLDRQLQRDAGMTHSQYVILVVLSEAPDRRLRLSELALRLAFSPSRLSHAVSRLEREGWVSREPCATDRRGAWAVLTDLGLQTLEAAAPGHVAEVRARVFDRLDRDQQRTLRELCTLIGATAQP